MDAYVGGGGGGGREQKRSRQTEKRIGPLRVQFSNVAVKYSQHHRGWSFATGTRTICVLGLQPATGTRTNCVLELGAATGTRTNCVQKGAGGGGVQFVFWG